VTGSPRLVVCALGASREYMGLPESRFAEDREYITGGERSLYELATAAAALGLDVELRGGINRPIFEELTSAAGAAPTVGLDARLPDSADIVVVPEGGEADLIAAVHLSGARPVLYLLAPPGLFGWSFLEGWTLPDLYTVSFDAVGRPETFRAVDDLGMTMWANARGMARAGERAGVLVEWLGTGTPVAFPADAVKCADVAIVAANRWSDGAEQVATRLTGATVLRIPAVPSAYSLSAALSPARILLWPSRLEGMSRIAREARAVGTVPVMLGTNPFVTAEDYGRGIVVVPDLDSLAEEAERLLADPDRLDGLMVEGKESVRQQVDWNAFLARVEGAISRVPERPPRSSRAALGELLRTRYRADTDAMAAHAERVTQRAEGAEMHATNLQAHVDGLETQLSSVQAELGRVAAQRDTAVELRNEDQVALRTTRGALEASQAEVDAYRARLVTRLVDRSPIGFVWGRLRSLVSGS
jgi:hypothetical protein